MMHYPDPSSAKCNLNPGLLFVRTSLVSSRESTANPHFPRLSPSAGFPISVNWDSALPNALRYHGWDEQRSCCANLQISRRCRPILLPPCARRLDYYQDHFADVYLHIRYPIPQYSRANGGFMKAKRQSH